MKHNLRPLVKKQHFNQCDPCIEALTHKLSKLSSSFTNGAIVRYWKVKIMTANQQGLEWSRDQL